MLCATINNLFHYLPLIYHLLLLQLKTGAAKSGVRDEKIIKRFEKVYLFDMLRFI